MKTTETTPTPPVLTNPQALLPIVIGKVTVLTGDSGDGGGDRRNIVWGEL